MLTLGLGINRVNATIQKLILIKKFDIFPIDSLLSFTHFSSRVVQLFYITLR